MDQRVQDVIALMKRELHHQPSLDALAQSAGLSRSRLQHLFKKETGITPSRYLRRLRMEWAGELLKGSTLSIKEIMVRVGMRDRSHFDRAFKGIYDLTPAQYRVKEQRAGLDKGGSKPSA